MFKRSPLSIAILAATAISPFTATQATQLDTVEIEAKTLKNASQTQITPVENVLQNGNSETGTALRDINGVQATRMGGHGVDLVIRGQNTSQLNILLDGAKIEGGCPNRMDPPTAYVELSSYDQITVIKGVGTLTEAAGGTGGTVLFERSTPEYDPNKTLSGEVNVGGTTNGLNQDMNATVTARGEKVYMILQGSKKSAENYLDGHGDEVNTSYESRQGHMDLGWTPDEHHEFKLSYEKSLIEDALFQGAMMDAPESDGRTTRLQYRGKDLRAQTGFIDDVEVDLYQSEVDHIMDNYTLRPAGSMKMINQTNVTTDGAKIKLSSMIGHTQLDYGVQTEVLEKNSNLKNAMNKSAWLMWPDVKTQTNSVFAESTSFFKDNQKVIMGLRYDMFDAEARKAATASDMGNIANNLYQSKYGTTGVDNDSSDLSALIRYERQLNKQTEIFAGLSHSYRYPDATELYIAKGGSMGSWVGNPNLKPEEHNQFDIGIAQNYDNFQWSASVFYDKVNNYILADKVGMDQLYFNRDAKLYGLELSANTDVSKNVTLGMNTNVTRGQNTTDNRDLANMTPVSGNVFAQYRSASVMAGMNINFAAEQNDVDSVVGEVETAGWSTVDLYSHYQINKQITLMAGVDNLFDRAYQTAQNRVDPLSGGLYNLNEPGRIIWAKVNAKF